MSSITWQLADDIRKLITELEHLQRALTLLGLTASVRAVEETIRDTRQLLKTEQRLYH